MTSSRAHRILKGRAVLYGAALICIISVYYFYQSYQQNFESNKQLHHNCLAEQASLASQLQASIEHREHLNKALASEKMVIMTIKAEDKKEKEGLTHRLANLQNHLKSVSADCNRAEKAAHEHQLEAHKCKISLAEVKLKSQDEVEIWRKEIKKLREKVQKLQLSNPVVQSPMVYANPKAEIKNVTKQIEIAKDVFTVIISPKKSAGAFGGMVSQNVKSSTNSEKSKHGDIVLKPNNENSIMVDLSSDNKDKLRPAVPYGFAPELLVQENDKNKMSLRGEIALGLAEMSNGVKPPNRYEVKLTHAVGDEDLEKIENDKKLSPSLDKLQNTRNELSDAFRDIQNILPKENADKVHRSHNNDNADFNEVNISLDQAEPALVNNMEEEDDENEDYDSNKLDFQGGNRNN